MKLSEIAQKLGGELLGDKDPEITGVTGIEFAGPGDITFLANSKYQKSLDESEATAVLVEREVTTRAVQVVVKNPELAFARLLSWWYPAKRPKPGVDPSASLGEGVVLDEGVTVSPLVRLGDGARVGAETVLHANVVVGEGCVIGERCVLHPNVTLYPGTQLGNDVILHSGVVLGTDGFGYTPDEKGWHIKIPQLGRVVVEDHVEIGANSCIDRAAFHETRIRKGTKIDNLVQVGHNCTIGEHSVLVAQAGVSGSCTLGHHVIVGGQAGIADHITIGDCVSLLAHTGVMRDIESNQVQGGSPNMSRLQYARNVALQLKLPEMATKLKELEKRLQAIENNSMNE